MPIAVGGDFHLGIGMELTQHVEGHRSDVSERPFCRFVFDIGGGDIERGA